MSDFILSLENIRIVKQVNDWRRAIQLAAEPLLKQELVDQTYADAVIRNMKKYGSSFIVSPYVILPHARPEQGVKKNSISILLTQKPFYYETQTTPIKLLILLAPEDSRSHLRMLQLVSNVVGDHHRLQKVMEGVSTQMIYEQFHLVETMQWKDGVKR